MFRGRKFRRVILGLGVLCILAGVFFIVQPFFALSVRSNNDNSAMQGWLNKGSTAVKGAVPTPGGTSPNSSPSPAAANCGQLASSQVDYALVKFPSLGYSGVAGDGTWDLLDTRSMVHYSTSAPPGGEGNMIIAFHREPSYPNMTQLAVGDLVTVQDRNCEVFTYQITQKWTETPSQVNQLVPTDGKMITLITCTPWWQDYERLVFRGTLVS